MPENEFTIPFETGVQDSYAEGMLDAFAIGRWTTDLEGARKALAELYSFKNLFAQMTKDQLMDIARMLNEETESLAIWGGDEVGKGATVWPGSTTLRAMKKDALIAYLASAYVQAIPMLILRLDLSSMSRLIELAEREDATLIGLVPEGAQDAMSGEGRIDIAEQYGDLILSGLLIAKRMWRFQNILYYGLFMPDEARAFLREHSSSLVVEWLSLDIVDCYARAASNLYGIVSVENLLKIIGRYEARIAGSGAGYAGTAMLDQLITDAKRDGDLDDYRDLTERRREIAAELRSLDVRDLMNYVHMASGRSDDYDMLAMNLSGKRVMAIVSAELISRAEDDDALHNNAYELLREQKGKPQYYPATYETFMTYADGMINDDVPAAKFLARLSSWLIHKHRREIVKAIRRDMEEPDESVFAQRFEGVDDKSIGMAADEIAGAIYGDIVCTTLHDFKHTTGFEVLERKYGILMRGMAEANEYFSLWNEINSNARMFGNNGHTPLEIRAKMPPRQGPAKLTFGPGMQGTELPKAIQKAIQSGEFGGQLTVDDAEVRRAGVKIGRNAPCPCGSGKKYKHCCGKNT